MRASISKPTPFIYLAFEKNGPIHILDQTKCWPIHYCPLIFCTHFLLVITQISVNSYNTKMISSLEKSLSEKYVHIPGCHIGIQKNRAIHILFVEKRGLIIYMASAEKGGYSARILCHIYIGSYPPAPLSPPLPPPPPPPPPCSYTWSSKTLTHSYTALWFFFWPTYCWLLDKYRSQFIEYQENKQPRKISEWKICAYTRMSEKWSLLHRNSEKSGHSYTFCEKGGQSYTWQLWKGGHSARTSVLCHM